MSQHFQYGALDRLTQLKGPNPKLFDHDPAHNIPAATGSAEEAKQEAGSTQVSGNCLKFRGDTHYQYDIHGNRNAALRGKNQKLKTRYRYNSKHHLIAVAHYWVDVKGEAHLQGETCYQYDALGRRISKQGLEQTTDFLWDGDVLLQESARDTETGQDLKSRTYYFEPATFKPIALSEGGEVYSYHLDHLSTPDALTDVDGEVVWSVSYRIYGSLAIAHKSEITQPIRFQGQYFDEESGLHYNRFRYYDPVTGAFIAPDPVGLLGSRNFYRYAPNPNMWVDPFGLSCKEGVATIYKIGAGRDMHFAIEMETKAGTKKATHQLGMQGTKTLIDDFEVGDHGEVEVIKIQVPNAKKAKEYQDSLIMEADRQLADANYDLEKLNIPEYDIVNRSCLTHIFDVLRIAGVCEAPKTSDPRNRDKKSLWSVLSGSLRLISLIRSKFHESRKFV